MKCAKCGSKVNPGDQVCISCGARLSSDNAYIAGLEKPNNLEKKNKKNLALMYILLGILLLLIIISVFMILRGQS